MADKRDLGVALSGGGVRATAFSLGAMLYLVDSGLNRRVGAVASVSGGSIVNGALARPEFDYGKANQSEFDQVARELVFLLTRRPIMGWLVVAVYSVLIGLGVLAALVAVGWPLVAPPWLRITAPLAWGLIFLFRGWPIELWLHRYYFAQHKLGDFGGADERSLVHVFCATELGRAAPVYFGAARNGFAFSPEYGAGRANHIRIATAVRASAALPGAFPPRLIRTKAIRFVGRQRKIDQESPPSAMFLADGGVWNNLGTQWFDGPGPMVFSATSIPSGAEVSRLLVLNASGPLKAMPKMQRLALAVPFVGEALGFGRVISSLYANTVEPRIRQSNALLATALQHGTAGSETDADVAVAGIDAPGAGNQMARARVSLMLEQVMAHDDRDKRMEIARRVTEDATVLGDESSLQEFAELLATNGPLAAGEQRLRSLEGLIEDVESVGAAALELLPSSTLALVAPVGLGRYCSNIGTKLSRLSNDEVIALLVHGYMQAMEAAAGLSFISEEAAARDLVNLPTPERFSRLLPDA